MGLDTSIEWCDSTLNLQMGCDGCELWTKDREDCYAGVQTGRYAGFSKGYPEAFDKPQIFAHRIMEVHKWPDLRGKNRPNKPWLNGLPRMVFLDDMGDTFTESLSIDWLASTVVEGRSLMNHMEFSPHVYMLLTKRPVRMAAFFNVHKCPRNFVLGTSVTEQGNARRITTLLCIESRYKFVSYEPAWGPIDFLKVKHPIAEGANVFNGLYMRGGIGYFSRQRVDLLILGGQSGPRSKPCNLDWLRCGVEQVRDAGSDAFVKQLGTNAVQGSESYVTHGKGDDMSEWPTDLQIREFPRVDL